MKRFPLWAWLLFTLLLSACATDPLPSDQVAASESWDDTSESASSLSETASPAPLVPETASPETAPTLAEATPRETENSETIPVEHLSPSPQPTETVFEAATRLPLCPKGLHTNIPSEEAWGILLEIHSLVTEADFVSVYYTDTKGEYFFGIGEETPYHSASTIKAAYCGYLIESGADLNQTVRFTHSTRSSSSGRLTADSIGKEFTVGELIRYTLRSSDNQAYRLLFDTFGTEGYNRYVSEMGAEGLMLSSDNEWAFCSAKDLSAVMVRIFLAESENLTVTEHLKNTEFNAQIREGTSHAVAHKYGYNGKNAGYHDTAIVYDPSRPYVLTVMTLLDPNSPETNPLFQKLVSLCDRLNVVLFGGYTMGIYY